MKKVLLSLLFFSLFFSCDKVNIEHPYNYYYWKTTFKLSKVEAKALEAATADKLYIRLFDIDKINNRFEPLGVIEAPEKHEHNKELVPVIFIANRAFNTITKEELNFLAQKTFSLIENKMASLEHKDYSEIQIDCDWTSATKEDYFNFLERLKVLSNRKISSTLRLHQVKDKNLMGIPPVKSVSLMCYATTSPLDDGKENSILDVALLKNYLENLDQYPIKDIDIALPIYTWAIVTNTFGEHRLINGINKDDLNNSNFKKLNDSEAIVLNDGFYFGKYLNSGFKIKVEEISSKKRQEVVRYIENKIGNFGIIYYQLDEQFLHQKL